MRREVAEDEDGGRTERLVDSPPLATPHSTFLESLMSIWRFRGTPHYLDQQAAGSA